MFVDGGSLDRGRARELVGSSPGKVYSTSGGPRRGRRGEWDQTDHRGPAGASVQEPTVLPNKKTETDLTTGR